MPFCTLQVLQDFHTFVTAHRVNSSWTIIGTALSSVNNATAFYGNHVGFTVICNFLCKR